MLRLRHDARAHILFLTWVNESSVASSQNLRVYKQAF